MGRPTASPANARPRSTVPARRRATRQSKPTRSMRSAARAFAPQMLGWRLKKPSDREPWAWRICSARPSVFSRARPTHRASPRLLFLTDRVGRARRLAEIRRGRLAGRRGQPRESAPGARCGQLPAEASPFVRQLPTTGPRRLSTTTLSWVNTHHTNGPDRRTAPTWGGMRPRCGAGGDAAESELVATATPSA